MTIQKLVRLKFGRSLAHFGELGIGMEESSERLRSDTLFSAWVTSYARLAGARETGALMTEFRDSSTPPFRLSSSFIYRRVDAGYIDYLPRPSRFPEGYPIGEDFEFAKAYRGIKYLPLSVWQRWYQQGGFDNQADRLELLDYLQKQAQGPLAQAGTFSYAKAFSNHRVPRASLDRRSNAANLYHTGFVQYDWHYDENGWVESLAGLYFLVEFSGVSSVTPEIFLEVMEFLGEDGIGGERSSGAGQFEVEMTDLPEDWQALLSFGSGNAHSLISLLWQDSISVDMVQQASYELQERGGWITSPSAEGRQQRRKAVQMFAEGSVFREKLSGALADVTPDGFHKHPIYRSGISFSLPIHAKL
jgi:CRISPR-associated protein Csm4